MSMNSCVILGASCSGKSLLASMLMASGYTYGNSVRSFEKEARGFLEDADITTFNTRILIKAYHGSSLTRLAKFKLRWKLSHYCGLIDPPLPIWFASVSRPLQFDLDENDFRTMRALLSPRPFALNDSNFCYLLSAWHPIVQPCKYICVFRNPAAHSKAAMNERILDGRMNQIGWIREKHIRKAWRAMYLHILRYQMQIGGEWLFVHLEDLFSEDGCSRVEDFLGAKLDHSVICRGSSEIEQSASQELDQLDEQANFSVHKRLLEARSRGPIKIEQD